MSDAERDARNLVSTEAERYVAKRMQGIVARIAAGLPKASSAAVMHSRMTL